MTIDEMTEFHEDLARWAAKYEASEGVIAAAIMRAATEICERLEALAGSRSDTCPCGADLSTGYSWKGLCVGCAAEYFPKDKS